MDSEGCTCVGLATGMCMRAAVPVGPLGKGGLIRLSSVLHVFKSRDVAPLLLVLTESMTRDIRN